MGGHIDFFLQVRAYSCRWRSCDNMEILVTRGRLRRGDLGVGCTKRFRCSRYVWTGRSMSHHSKCGTAWAIRLALHPISRRTTHKQCRKKHLGGGEFVHGIAQNNAMWVDAKPLSSRLPSFRSVKTTTALQAYPPKTVEPTRILSIQDRLVHDERDSFFSLQCVLAEGSLGVSVRHSVNVKRMPLEMHHVNQHVGTTRVAALKP